MTEDKEVEEKEYSEEEINEMVDMIMKKMDDGDITPPQARLELWDLPNFNPKTPPYHWNNAFTRLNKIISGDKRSSKQEEIDEQLYREDVEAAMEPIIEMICEGKYHHNPEDDFFIRDISCPHCKKTIKTWAFEDPGGEQDIGVVPDQMKEPKYRIGTPEDFRYAVYFQTANCPEGIRPIWSGKYPPSDEEILEYANDGGGQGFYTVRDMQEDGEEVKTVVIVRCDEE